jgi:short subunit dehydrogenase-like uncharacterized protein
MKTWMIYGANGYTGALVARYAAERGMQPILAGRNATQVIVEANGLHLPHRVFPLDDPAALDSGLDGVDVVLNCAGPFSQTARPMVAACIRKGVHYVDVTGELEIFEALAAMDDAFRSAEIMVLPGAGFDVVATDTVAAHLKERLPTATSLTLAFRGLGVVSRGTAATAVESMASGSSGMIRRNGVLVKVPPAWRTREVDFGKGKRQVVSMPWGDVSTAWYSTGIENIEVYMAATDRMVTAMRAGRYLGPLLRLPYMRDILKYRIHARMAGPTDAQRQSMQSVVWGRAEDPSGAAVECLQTGPEGYTYTALATLEVVNRVLAGDRKIGFQTPSAAYGPDWVLDLEGVSRTDLA